MSKEMNTSYNILKTNTHLLNIYDSEYYIELGTININFLDELLKGKINRLTDCYNHDILTSGIGKITNDKENDELYQLDYLYSSHVHSSSNKICLTIGTIRYLDDVGTEKYAPVILIPVTINVRNNMIYIAGEATINHIFRRYSRSNKILDEASNEYLNSLKEVKFSEVDEIDKVLLNLLNDYNLAVSTDSYLTKIDIEYPDIVIPQGVFDPQGSIFEMSDIDIYNEFFKNCTPVLPANIEQQHIILAFKMGKNFAVEGRVGSGKTTTIINIITEAAISGKKVLYINHDISSINEVRNVLNRLGMSNYICELNNSIVDYNFEERTPLGDRPEFDITILDKLKDIEDLYQYQYHGYTYRYIIENLACMRQSGDDKLISTSDKLVKDEVKYIYSCLKEIEDELSYVDPFTNNIWSMLLSSATAPSVEETIDRTNYFYEVNKELMDTLKSFVSSFGLHTIVDINDFNHLNAELLAIERYQPLPIWTTPDFNDVSTQALNKLSNEIDIYFNSLDWYHQHTFDNYEPSKAKECFNVILGHHFSVKNEKDKDYIYVDRLLNEKKEFDSLIKHLNEIIITSVKEYDETKKFFDFTEPSKEQFEFLNKLLDLLEKYTVLPSWMKEYVKSPKDFLKNGDDIENKLKELDAEVLKIKAYFDIEDVEFSELDNLVSSKNFTKVIKARLDKKKLKQNHHDLKDIIQEIKIYHKLVHELTDLLPNDLKIKKLNELVLKNYLGFISFLRSLSSYEIICFNSFVNKNTDSIENIKKVENNLRTIKKLTNEVGKINKELKHYKLDKEADNFISTVKALKSNMPYYERIIHSRDQIHSFIKDLETITPLDVLILIEVDNKYLDNDKEFNDAKARYIELFGKGFEGYNTQVLELRNTIANFARFMKRIKPNKDILNLIDDSKGVFSKLISHNQAFIQAYDKWFNALRGFSGCFFSGKMDFQNLKFTEVEKSLKEYINRFDQVRHISRIEHILDTFYKYKLDELAEKIQSGEYYENLAQNFLYSTLFAFYQNMISDGFVGFNKYSFDYSYNHLLESLGNFINNNIIKVRNRIKYSETSKERKKKKLIYTNDNFDEFVKQVPSYQKIYLADVEASNAVTNFSYFDLVVVDDAHLSTANKYYKLFNEFHQFSRPFQLIIFGDKMFHSSVTNSLMHRIDKKYFLKLKKRYILLSNEASNNLVSDNQYIYDNNTHIKTLPFSSVDDFIEKIVLDFETTNHRMCVAVVSEESKRYFYTKIVENLLLAYSKEDILKIMNRQITITILGDENNYICDELYLWYNDFNNLQIELKRLYLRNYYMAEGTILFGYKATKSVKALEEFNSDMTALQESKTKVNPFIDDSIVKYMYSSLLRAGLNLELGPGLIDITITNNDNRYGVIVLGKNKDERYSIVDDLFFILKEYPKKNWKLLVYSIEELYDHYDKIIYDIKTVVGE